MIPLNSRDVKRLARHFGLDFETATGKYHIRKEDHQGLGEAYIAKVGARDADPGYGIVDAIAYSEAEVAEPPSPGKPVAL